MNDDKLVVHVGTNLGEAMRAGQGAMSPEYDRHMKFKRTCLNLERGYGAYGNTCNHHNNSSAIKICSHDCCPVKKEALTLSQYIDLTNLRNKLNRL
jgi:hypothetical protein